MAQTAHGTAPDIAVANPFSLVLSAALLLDWHGCRKGEAKFATAASAIEKGIEAAVAARETTGDIGGTLGTRETGEALAARLKEWAAA